MLITQGDIDPIGRQCVESLLANQICRSAYYCQSTASTNAWALADLSGDIDETELPRLYFTDQQTAGRGRHGRSWHSGQQAVALSLLLPWPIDALGPHKLLSLAVGVAVARAIEYTCAPLQTKLKWPNDVYIDGGKVAGILIETNQRAPDRVVIGVGINVNAAPDHADLLAGAQQQHVVQPKSLAGVTGRTISRFETLHAVVDQTMTATQEILEDEATILNEFRSRCLLVGSTVSIRSADGPQVGECLGITDGGELAIQFASHIHHLSSGEAHQVRISQ